MKLLFVGGTGNISTECASLLNGRGHEIYVLTRGRAPVAAECRAIRGDRKDRNCLAEALTRANPDVILNFIGFDVSDLELDFAVFGGRVRQYLFISSATVYLKPPPEVPVREQTPLGNAWWDYAQKKIACEQWLQEKYRECGFPVTIIRPSHTYSRHWIPNPVASAGYTFAARLEQGRPVFVPDDGENPWTLTAASDFAAGLAGLVGNFKAAGEAFHITSDEVLTWNRIYAAIAAELGVSNPEVLKVPTEFICTVAPQLTGPLKGDKTHPGIFDNTKIKQWVPEFNCHKLFRAGIREAIDFLRQHPEKQNLNPQVDSIFDRVTSAWKEERKGL